MQLAAGEQLGPYLIEEHLGSGGMGHVYKARDTRLSRTVAVKICDQQFSSDIDREARAIAALNHPHVCTVHDVGPNYLVMEFLEGQTLADYLRNGALPLAEVIRYGTEIADALAAAHERGITHRDLKPANIMLTKAGAKVLDFGVAKMTSNSETTQTVTGMLVGTPAYMAPEQIRRGTSDARTDIYGLGMVLHEMAMGKRFVPGQPLLKTKLPSRLVHVIDRCLAQDPADRWQAASDVRRELEWAAQPEAPSVPVSRDRLAWALAGVLAAICLASAWYVVNLRNDRTTTRLIRAEINAPGTAVAGQGIALSPDGQTLAVVTEAAGTSRLWVRSLESLSARDLPGTEGATFPFWSPDNQSIGFFASGKLKRVAIAGGMPAVICDVGRGRGGSWNAQDTIIFNSVNDGPLLRVSATGGVPEAVTAVNTAKGENSHRWPCFLPDGQRFLYYIRATDAGVEGLYLGSLDDRGEKRRLLQTKTNGVYVSGGRPSSGYLAWVQQGNLMVQPVNAATMQLLGRAVSLAENVALEPAQRMSDIAATPDVLVYRVGENLGRQLTWYDREGKVVGTLGTPEAWLTMRMSPDGSQILVSRPFSGDRWGGIGIMNVGTGIATPFLAAFPGAWSPDGRNIAYGWSSAGAPNIYVKAVATQGAGTRLTQSGNSQAVLDWSRDGRFILYVEHSNDISTGLQSNLMIAPTNGDGRPIRYATTSTRDPTAQFSPDGRWIAYTSAEDGRTQVYIESFPSGRGKWQVSQTGGNHPRWASAGKELVYLTGDGTLMAVPIRPNSLPPHFGAPTALFKVHVSNTYFAGSPYDVAADGRILALAYSGERRSSVAMLLNWTQWLRNNKGL